MARDIPTFQSDRVSNIPNMGIVADSGSQAIGQAMQQRARVFDVIGDFANQKADQMMAREQKIAAEEAVLAGGLDPATLKNPFTKADQIYREAALNTYSIQIEDNIEKNLFRLYSESKYDPQGFAKKADSFLKGTVSGLAPELKSPVLKFAQADARKKAFSLEQERKQKMLQEAESIEKLKIEEYKAALTNATDEDERENLTVKIGKIIQGSQSYLTDELKLKVLNEHMRDVTKAVTLNQIADRKISISQAEEIYKQNNIPVTVSEMQTFYSAYNLKSNFALQQVNQRKAEQQAAIDAQINNIYQTFDTIDNMNIPQELKQKQKIIYASELTSTLKSAGMYKEAAEQDIAIKKHIYDSIVEPDGMEEEISFDIAKGNYELATQRIYTNFNSGVMKASTKNRLLTTIQTKTDNALQENSIKINRERIANEYAPMALTAARPDFDIATLNEESKKQLQEDIAFMDAYDARVISLSSQGKSPEEIENIINQSIKQNYLPKRKTPDSPAVANYIYQPNFSFMGIDKNTVSNFPVLDNRSSEVFEGPWTKENFSERISIMETIAAGNNHMRKADRARLSQEIQMLKKYQKDAYGID